MKKARWIGVLSAAACATLGVGAAASVVPAVPSAEADPIVLAAGDVANCDGDGDPQTATIIDQHPGATVAALGDLAYYAGTPDEFQSCYEPTWGRHKGRTRPAPGNHEYGTPGAAGYFGYFGSNAGPAGKGWYSYDLGTWHVVVLNSNCDAPDVDCDPGSEQLEWLQADLAAHPTDCTLAYWHHPLFTSGWHAGEENLAHVRPFWDALYEHGADVILNGHDHNYERFYPQTPAAERTSAYGIRQFVVGTGGASLRPPRGPFHPNAEVFDWSSDGVLKLVLSAGGYSWDFLAEPGSTFTDSGANNCHAAPDLAPPEGKPTLASSHGPSWSNDNSVQISWTGASDSGSGVDGFSYSFTQGADDSPDAVKDAEETASSTTSPALADGEWWFHLRTRDNAGNWSNAVHLGPFRIDTSAPANPSLSGSHAEGDWSNDNTVEATWGTGVDTGSGVDGFSYSWSQAAADSPDSVKDVEESSGSTTSPALADGSWWFHLRTRDNAGNWSDPVHRGPFKIDTTAPTNPTLSSPSHAVGEWSNEDAVTVEWSGASGLVYSHEWSLGDADIPDTVPEGTETRVTSLRPDGQWWFHVRAKDSSNSWSGTSHIGPFQIDTTAPQTTIASGPPASTTGTDAAFSFAAPEPASYQCALDGAALTGCSSPARYAGLGPGDHVFRVLARDRAGNLEHAPREYRWRIEPAAAPPPPPPPPPPPLDPPPKRPPVGAKPCIVPRLAGKTLPRARGLITAAGCRLGSVRRVYSQRVGRGLVVTQRPRARLRLSRGARINLVLSRGLPPRSRRAG